MEAEGYGAYPEPGEGYPEDTIADVDASGLWPGKAVTQVVPAGDFCEAEPERQDYLERNPGGYTCHFVRPNWKLPVRTAPAYSGCRSKFSRTFSHFVPNSRIAQ